MPPVWPLAHSQGVCQCTNTNTTTPSGGGHIKTYTAPMLTVEGSLHQLTLQQTCGTSFDGNFPNGAPTNGRALNGISGPGKFCLVPQR